MLSNCKVCCVGYDQGRTVEISLVNMRLEGNTLSVALPCKYSMFIRNMARFIVHPWGSILRESS